ncbi:hypothetical protein PR001_g20589 [Phytophthora rubi]|uniref:Protein kinase domain-containing protein n=1 Tax=Phytophthora rubi TaxID=129364 RepID=A0A6A3JGS6_9STRA|nr:hypothetical protein PR001_g20589 [Phytophthora rubi]
MDTFVWISSERKLVVSGMGLVQSGRDGLDGELHRAANVMLFGLALLDIFRRTRGDWGDQVNEEFIATRQLPASKPDCLNDREWELIGSMCSVNSADRPSMVEVVWKIEYLVTLEERNRLEIDEEINTTAERETRTQALDRANDTISKVSELVDQLCEEEADNDVSYRSVSDRLVNIYQQLEEYREAGSILLIEDFTGILLRFYDYLRSEMSSDVSSIDSLFSIESSDPTRWNDMYSTTNYKFHRDLDRLMNQAPNLLHTSQLHRWRHLLEETKQRRQEIMAAWEEMDAHNFNGGATDEGQDAFGAQFLKTLRKEERFTKNAVAINFLRRDVEKKVDTYNSEPRLLMRWAHTGYIVRIIHRAIESAVGILEFTSAKMEWFEAFEGERKQRISFYQELLADSGRITLEMGDNCQIREIYTVLLYSRDEYASELSASERNITLSLFEKLKQQLNGDIISLPSWFAMSESQWSFAERSVLSGDEASCVQQIEICQELNHPNVCKFYGAYHVGRTPFVVLDETVAFNAKLSFEDKDVWRLLLGYANGLQYILSRGLAYTSLSLADFRVTWDGKPVLSGIGLVRQTIDHLDDTQRKQSAASNVLAFGLIVFQILALKHLLSTKAVRDFFKDDSPKLQYVQELSKEWFRVMRERDWPPRLEIGAASDDIQAGIGEVSNKMTEDEWNLLRSLCKVTSVDRADVAKFISQMKGLAQAREAPGTPVEKAPAKVLEDVNEVICSSSGRKLKEVLDEIEEELEEISDQFQEDNRRVVDRLLDIYCQLESPEEPLLAAVVEDFVGLVQSYHIQVSRRLENSDFSASDVMRTSVALTVADRNESTHHLLDELIWNSGCLSSKSAVHQWQEHSRKKARLRSQKMMDTVLEDEEDDDDTSGGSPRWLLPTDEVQLLKRIARGAFGAAYWGKWLDTDVVVKKVLTNQHESRNRLQFRHEVELWFSLNHANVIKLYGACHEYNKQPVFVCEQAVYGTLSSFLKDKPAEAIWGALYTAAQGLRHLHERGIVHGDLKGNNVLVTDNNFVKLADFGLSAIAKPVLTPVDKPGSIGAIRWRAPECIQGFMPTFASDIYSFGMCIVEVVTALFRDGRIG